MARRPSTYLPSLRCLLCCPLRSAVECWLLFESSPLLSSLLLLCVGVVQGRTYSSHLEQSRPETREVEREGEMATASTDGRTDGRSGRLLSTATAASISPARPPALRVGSATHQVEGRAGRRDGRGNGAVADGCGAAVAAAAAGLVSSLIYGFWAFCRRRRCGGRTP